MSWVKLDDGFYDNPKILRVGLVGAGLYTSGLAYAARKLTDGFLSHHAVTMLVHDDQEHRDDLIARLVNAGLWQPVAGGFQVHDFLDYNPPAAYVRAERDAAKDRMRRLRSGDVRANMSRSSPDVPDPVPVPVPGSVPRSDKSKKTLGFAQFWLSYPKKRHKPDAEKAWCRIAGDECTDAIVAGVLRWKTSDAWSRGFIEDPGRFLRQRQWEDDPRATEPSASDRAAEILADLQASRKDRG